MFDFLKIFRKKEPEPKTEKVKLSELENFAKKIETEEMSVVYGKIRSIQDKLTGLLKELNKASENLKDARFTKDMDQRLEKRVLVARENLADKGVFFSTNLLEKKFEINDWESVLEFHKKYKTSFNELNAILLKHAPFIKVGFNREIIALSGLFKKISLAMTELEKEIKENHEVFEVTSKLTHNSRLLFETWQGIEKARKDIQTKKKELDDLNKSRQTLGEKLTEIKNSEKYKAAESAKKRISEIEKEILAIKIEIRNETNILNKALKKYLYAKGDLLNKNQKELAEMFSDEPLNCVIGGNLPEIKIVLEDMQKMIQEKQIELDEKTSEKVNDSMESIFQIFEQSIKKFESVSKEKKALMEKIESQKDEQYEETLKTIEVSKKWSSLLEEKIFEITKKETEYAKIFESTKTNVLETLKNRFDIDLTINTDQI